MATRIRTLNFLPDIFKTPTNAQFLRATLDQVVDQPNLTKIEGYVGSKFGYGLNANSYYVTEPTKIRVDYQLEPGVVFLKQNTNTAKDFISYPGIIDALKLEGAVTNDNNRLFTSQYYAWDSLVDLDKVINYNQYYWIPTGLPQVTVAVDSVFDVLSYIVLDNTNGYNIASEGSNVSATNPTITLLRGGIYTFAVNQNSQFWIQGEPGVTGFSRSQPNLQTRDVLGVQNNGESSGLVTFTVPTKDAQDQYDFPGNNLVGLVTSLPYESVNGMLVSAVGNIDGVTAMDGKTLMFFNTGIIDEQGYVSNFYDAVNYDFNNNIVANQTIAIINTTALTNVLTCASTAGLLAGQTVTFTGTTFGGVLAYLAQVSYPGSVTGLIAGQRYSITEVGDTDFTLIGASSNDVGVIFEASAAGAGTGTATRYNPSLYYVKDIVSLTQFTITETLSGPVFAVTTATGSMTANINQGLYEGGYFTDVSGTFYTITYVGDSQSQVIRLVPAGAIPTEQKITASYGVQWVNRSFFRDSQGSINLIPYLSSLLDTLYYQDGTSSNKVGKFKLIDNNLTNTLNIVDDILGKKQYTAPNGVVFTNGLKINFVGDIYPASYENVPFYVEGVGTAIELIPVADLIAAEIADNGEFIPFDSSNYDIGNFDASLYVPVNQDYITIARNAVDRNAWSRSNRWFHVDVITATATYNQDPVIVSTYATQALKAKRPVIEFYPNLKMFNSGVLGKKPIDFIDFRTTDAFAQVEGKSRYFPDVNVYTSYVASIQGVSVVISSAYQTTVDSTVQCASVVGFSVNDKISFTGTTFGGVVADYTYYIRSINTINSSITLSISKDGDITTLVAATGTMGLVVIPLSTTVTVPRNGVTGTFLVGQYIVDSAELLPVNSRISAITGTTTLTLTVSWDKDNYGVIPSGTAAALIATVGNSDNYSLFDGARVVFANDTNEAVRNKIYTSRISSTSVLGVPIITLTESSDGEVLADELTFVYRGANYHSKDFYFNGLNWVPAQQKNRVNQPPLFDIMDHNGISFSNQDYYTSSSFAGTTLFSYGKGTGLNDAVLGFPLRYSSVDNVGDISFDVSLNLDTFNYVVGQTPFTQLINTGYVFNYSSLDNYTRLLGWQTAVAPSTQYQIFNFTYVASSEQTTYKCDVAMIDPDSTQWPSIQVYVNNVVQSDFEVQLNANSTTVVFTVPNPAVDTIVQILLLSDQVSATAYYDVPINLNNNPLNGEVTTVNVGDVRRHYQSIFYNAPNMTGLALGPNNYRDSGNLVPYGNAIVQNSASLVLPGTFLRKQNHNLFDALLFNNREYIAFKTLLMHTVNNTAYATYPTAADMLDAAIDQITVSKTEDSSFFWSDMLPTKAAYISNKYAFANSLDNSIYPLSRIYDFTKANYYGIVVYLSRIIDSVITTSQFVRDVDYIVSTDSPSLTITTALLPGDRIDIREYNQTYGSYVPNTPTKLGLYPATIPEVRLDSNYLQPTYFIVGHDGSFTKLYGEYNAMTNTLSDFRDQALLEYELRVYSNLKIDAKIPINDYEIMPGFFRNTGYSADEVLSIYSSGFLNWIGQNRIEYQPQLFSVADEFSFNYRNSQNKLDNSIITQGFWRGLYEYLYDTSNPDTAPWEMLGFTNKPSWFDARYGAAPYTSDNLVLWNDLASGINWNNGDPVVITQAYRPGLLDILPVDSAGVLVSPFVSVVGNYVAQTFNQDWKVGDVGPAELSYRRSSSWPFDLMRILALTKPAEFFNLAVDLDNYRYNSEFNQYLVNNRSHLVISDIEIYGAGTAKTSYINWIVDYEKQVGISATQNITELLDNLDVRLVYRLAGFSDKNLLKFYVEKSSATSNNNTLLIPDESYSILLYDNQPFNRIVYSGVVIQLTKTGFKVFGSSQTLAYFTTLKPLINGNYNIVTIESLTVQIAKAYSPTTVTIPYGTEFSTVQEVSQFLSSYGKYLEFQGAVFDQVSAGLPVDWTQMVAEYLYWAQSGWEIGSILNVNPAAELLTINKDSNIVQPLTLRQQNFILNQNLYPIAASDLSIVRDGTLFSAQVLNAGDSINYGVFNISNFEHAVVFDNITVFGDRIYNLITGLRQDRIALRGTKTAEWDGTVDAQGFILNQDNIQEWSKEVKYTTGTIVTYKNKYWIALKIVQASETFVEGSWKQTDYNEIQKGLLPNPSTRSYESTIYYNSNTANLENDADLLGFSLIGYRPRDYLAVADLTDITQINVYKNLIKSKGTPIAASAFKGATLSQGGIDYTVYENWAIKTSEFGGVLNSNFVEFVLNENYLTSNPCLVGLTDGIFTAGVQQEVPIYSLFNYGRPITDPKILTVIPGKDYVTGLPPAGYVNFNDVKISAYYYADLSTNDVPLASMYVWDYIWLADYMGTWQVFTPIVFGNLIEVSTNLNGLATFTFDRPHSLSKYQSIAIVSFSDSVDGYYYVSAVLDEYKVQVPLTLNVNLEILTGNGTGFIFSSSRVATPSDISSTELLRTEFVKNTVWVDTNTDGDWAVYRKNINYALSGTLTSGLYNSGTFGAAVAFTTPMGYLVSDPSIGEVYRYSFNSLYKNYELTQKIADGQTSSEFGAIIKYAEDIVVITQAWEGPPLVYRLVVNTGVNSLLPFNNGLDPVFIDNGWSDNIAISGDKNWIYVANYTSTGDYVGNRGIYAYRKSPVTGHYNYVADRSVPTDATIWSPSNNSAFGYSLSTNYSGDTLIVGAPEQTYFPEAKANWGLTYVYNRTVQNFESQFNSLPSLPQTFPLVWSPSSISLTVEDSYGTDTVTADLISGSDLGKDFVIVVVGTTNWAAIGAPSGPWVVGQVFVANGVIGSGSGTAHSLRPLLATASDISGVKLMTPVIFTGAVFSDISLNKVYYINYLATPVSGPSYFNVSTTKITQQVVSTGGVNNSITVDSTAGFVIGQPIIFYGYSGNSLIDTSMDKEQTYYVFAILSDTEFQITESIGGVQYVVTNSINPYMTAVTLSNVVPLTDDYGTMYAIVQSTSLVVTVNGTTLTENSYAIPDQEILCVYSPLAAGDIITVSSYNFGLAQILTTEATPRTGVRFGTSVDNTTHASEILVGAPFEISDKNQEGAVYRYTNAGAKYGIIVGTSVCSIVAPITILLNGYSVTLPIGSAVEAANAINNMNITNIQASTPPEPVDAAGTIIPNYGILTIALIDMSLAGPNNKLFLTVLADDALTALGMQAYTQTQVINSPHPQQTTQFGSVVKFNEFDSVVVSAPTATRFVSTTFDFTDDAYLDNDTLFDNNGTQWVDTYKNAGAVYMFDYLANYNESLANVGKFTAAQSINDNSLNYGAQPMYGQALDFNDNQVVVGTPNFRPNVINGQVITYTNATGVRDWSVHRSSSPIVDINRVQDIQLFSAETNTTLDNLDYIDPLSGKLLGSVRQNIDVISSQDPAGYTTSTENIGALVWGADKVGHIWFNTSTTRFVNYHQNDAVYDSKYWGTVFPGSDVTVYTWISSTVTPDNYRGTGTPFDLGSYTTEYIINASDVLTPIYFFWVRNTNKVFTQAGKTLADSIIQLYIATPISSGISYFAPITAEVFALFNCGENINDRDTVLHIGFSSGKTDDVPHNLFSLIRADYADDFIPGLPGTTTSSIPNSLYKKLLDSLCGADPEGAVIPNPYLPKAVQYGIASRPNQSFFINRYEALKNYFTYANTILAQYPITEIKQPSLLSAKNPILYATVHAGSFNIGTTYIISYPGTTDFMAIGAESNFAGQSFVATGPGTGTGAAEVFTFNVGELYDTTNYWEYITWWATGYNNNTKAFMQVPLYADLATINAADGLIVTVEMNGYGLAETYIYLEGMWNRIGLQKGTIQFKSSLWDYSTPRLGFGDSFFDTTPYAEFPSVETRYAVRSLTEEIYTNELLIHRNKSLILLFEFIQSETTESQNYLPWLNKTSFIDVSHTIRELLPIPVLQSDNQEFLAGYLNEVKPYHVVIKEFIFKYTGVGIFEGDITDFDLPAQYNAAVGQFITPELVYHEPNTYSEFGLTDQLWQSGPYKEWYKNYGLSLTGLENYEITLLSSYMVLNTSECTVDNAFGFPISGIITIDNEQIGYSSVDHELSVLHGLTRGVNGTPIENHIPGTTVYINLPAILLLNSGRGYSNPPKVTAYFDVSVYPITTSPDIANPATGFRPAVLEAVMQFDTIMRIDVIDSGAGYPVTPEIVIAPADVISFNSAEVQIATSTIRIYSTTSFQTGDLIKYSSSLNSSPIGGLDDDQYYYVGVLDNTPTLIIALYTHYADSVSNRDRVIMSSTGSGNHYLQVVGLASCITSACPIRENITTLRFDRTSYSSRITTWIPGSFYSAFYAGLYNNSTVIASSSIQLESTRPSIATILASAAGAVFTLIDVTPVDNVTWSSTSRLVVSTLSTGTHGIIEIKPSSWGAEDFGTVGPTLGFYVEMPIKFVGAVIGGIIPEQVYYVLQVLSETQFTMSTSIGGAPVMLTTALVSTVELICYAGTRTLGTIITIDYPGIAEVTGTNDILNTITVPLTGTGQNGTNGYYIGLPVVFTGTIVLAGNFIIGNTYRIVTVGSTDFMMFGSSSNIPGTEFVATNVGGGSGTVSTLFGGITENDQYYVTTVVDSQTITVSRTADPLVVTITAIQPQLAAIITSTTTGTNELHSNVTDGFMVDMPIIFTGATFGNVTPDVIYYILTIDPFTNLITISDTVGGAEWPLTTDAGAMDANVNSVIICESSLSLNVNDPIIFNQMLIADAPVLSFGGIVSGVRYFISAVYLGNTSFSISTTVNGGNIPLSLVDSGIPNVPPITSCLLTSQTEVQQLTPGSGSMTITAGLPVSPGQINGQQFTLYKTSEDMLAKTGLDSNLVARVVASALGAIEIIGTESGTNLVTIIAGTPELTINDEITLTGTAFGGLSAGTYYIKAFSSYTTFTVSATRAFGFAGPAVVLSTAAGSLILTDVDNPVTLLNQLAITRFSGALTDIYTNMPFKLATAYGGLTAGYTYYVDSTGQVLTTVTNTSSSGNVLTCTSTVGFYPGMMITFTGAILGGLEYNLEYFVLEILSPTQFTIASSSVPFSTPIILTNENGAMIATGEYYFEVCSAPGSPALALRTALTSVVLTQAPVEVPEFDVSYILGGYRILISAPGLGYALHNVITITGSTINGVTPTNNLMLTVVDIDPYGRILKATASGTPNELEAAYYVKVISDSEAELYIDAGMTIPANGYEVKAAYPGIVSTAVTNAEFGTDLITVDDISVFSLNDEVVFTGFVGTYGNIIPGAQYYIVDIITIDSTISISENPAGAIFTLSSSTGTCVMSKPGTYLLLPEPFYFEQNIVTYNNRVYQCIISNNDAEFIFGKWIQLTSDNRKLNALDRIVGYYRPTVNMPGLDLTQLVTGISYPNSVYLGNAFSPEESFPIDTVLQDQPFYPSEVNLMSVAWDGVNYLAPADTPKYSAVINSLTGETWAIDKISAKPLQVTDIVYANGRYMLTTLNPATPILVSGDGITWTTNGEYTPFDTLPYSDIQFDMTAISVMNVPLYSAGYRNGRYVAVGNNIVTSDDTYAWTETFVFYQNGLVNTLKGVAGFDLPGFVGFVAVGKGQLYEFPVGELPLTVNINLLLLSTDGLSWNTPVGYTPLTEYGFNAVTASSTRIVIVGDNGVRYSSSSGSNWVSTSAAGIGNPDLNDIMYAAGMFTTVGDFGRIETSVDDGLTWTTQVSGTTEKLNGITYNSTSAEFVAVGDNNIILKSADGILWVSSSFLITEDPIYTVQGDAFLSGYGPEELVPGVVSDNLTFTVSTRPGSNWLVQEFAHTGYNVVSIEITPT